MLVPLQSLIVKLHLQEESNREENKMFKEKPVLQGRFTEDIFRYAGKTAVTIKQPRRNPAVSPVLWEGEDPIV